MPVYFYMGRDLVGRASEPVFHQEMIGVERICRHIWQKFQAQDKTYAVILNVQRIGVGQELSPDLVVISELGVGVVELKDYFGRINCEKPNGRWMAGTEPIMAFGRGEVDERGKPQYYINPAIQVRYYASCIRQELLNQPPLRWIKDNPDYWQKIKIQTAVCFTNTRAITSLCNQKVSANYRPGRTLPDWEIFSVITPAEFASWMLSLRFDVQMSHADWYGALSISPHEVLDLAEHFFGGQIWNGLTPFLQSPREPLGYLYLLDEHNREIFCFHLEHDDVLIGRKAETCGVIIPDTEAFQAVSREHARILSTAQGIYMEDANSLHGTFIDGEPVNERRQLKPGAIISLGSNDPAGPCRLKFVQVVPGSAATTSHSEIG